MVAATLEHVGDAWCVDKATSRAAESIKSPQVLEGNASHLPVVGTVVCESGRHTWRLLVDDNANNPIGLIRAEGQFDESMNCGPDSWAFWPCGRIVDLEGTRVERKLGPDRFYMPFQVEMSFDCSTGALSAIVDNFDIGIIAELPLGEPVRLAVGMNGGTVSILHYEQHVDLVLTCIPKPAVDGIQIVSCIKMSGDELAAIACGAGFNIAQLRTAVKEELGIAASLISVDGQILADQDLITSLRIPVHARAYL